MLIRACRSTALAAAAVVIALALPVVSAHATDYGTVRAECNRSAVGGGGTLSVGFNAGFPFGYATGQQFSGRIVAYVGSQFVALTDWHALTASSGGATGYSVDANHAVVGGTGAPGAGLSSFVRVPGNTWATGGVQTWTQSGGYRTYWVPPQTWGLPISGTWCRFP
jgi:hypothetical protein